MRLDRIEIAAFRNKAAVLLTPYLRLLMGRLRKYRVPRCMRQQTTLRRHLAAAGICDHKGENVRIDA